LRVFWAECRKTQKCASRWRNAGAQPSWLLSKPHPLHAELILLVKCRFCCNLEGKKKETLLRKNDTDVFSACVLAGMQCVPHARLLRLNQGVRGSSRRHLSCTKPPPTSPFAHESTQHSTLTNPLRSTSRLFSPFLFSPALDCRLGGTTSEQRNDAHALACSNRVLSLANPAHCNSPTPDGLTCGFASLPNENRSLNSRQSLNKSGKW